MSLLSRAELAERISADRAAWEALVADVPRGRMAEPGPMGDWSFRDLVSHLAAWRNRTIERLEAAGRGQARPANPWPAGMDADDPINEWFRERDATRDLDELLADYGSSFDRMLTALDAIPESTTFEETDDPGYLAWADANGPLQSDFFDHLAGHADDVRAWLAR